MVPYDFAWDLQERPRAQTDMSSTGHWMSWLITTALGHSGVVVDEIFLHVHISRCYKPLIKVLEANAKQSTKSFISALFIFLEQIFIESATTQVHNEDCISSSFLCPFRHFCRGWCITPAKRKRGAN
jgi:hypothetical protein